MTSLFDPIDRMVFGICPPFHIKRTSNSFSQLKSFQKKYCFSHCVFKEYEFEFSDGLAHVNKNSYSTLRTLRLLHHSLFREIEVAKWLHIIKLNI